MSRRKRHGRFRREIKRFSEGEFARSLALFADAIDAKPETFKPEGLPGFIAMQQRCVHYPDFAIAFGEARRQRIARLCERGGSFAGSVAMAPPRPVGGGHPTYDDESYRASLALLSQWTGTLRDFRPKGLPGYQALRTRAKGDQAFRKDFAIAVRGLARKPRGRRSHRGGAEAEAAFLLSIQQSNCRSKNQFQQRRPQSPSWNWAVSRAKANAAFRASFDAALKAKGWDKSFYATAEGRAELASRSGLRSSTPLYSEEQRNAILSVIASGVSITDALKVEGTPAYNTLVKWRKADPEFRQRLAAAKAAGRKVREPAARTQRRVYEQGQLTGQLLQNELWAAAAEAIKRFRITDENMRFGVISDMIEAALSGELEIDDMEDEASFFIAEHKRQMRASYFSLDKEIGNEGEGGMTYLDRLTSDHHDYAD